MTKSSQPRVLTVLDVFTREEKSLTPPALREEFDRLGVLLFPRFFTGSELAPIMREMDAYFSPIQARAESLTTVNRPGEAKFQCDVVPWEPAKAGNAEFLRFARHPLMAEATESVLGAGYMDGFSLVMFSVGGGRGQAWHQDCPPEDIAAFNLNRLIYPENVSLEDGAIVFVPGSHRKGRISSGGHQDPMDGEVCLPLEAGTLLFLHGHVYHRVTPNLNFKPRLSINFRAYPAGTSPDVTCVGVFRNGTVNFCDKPKQHDGTPVEEPAMGM